jgi:hypothetical protein
MSQKPLYDDSLSGLGLLPQEAYSAESTVTPFTLLPSQILGGTETFLASSGNVAAAVTLPTAASLFAYAQSLLAQQNIASANQLVNTSYFLRVINNNTGILTLSGGTGCTINGTATLAASSYRDYVVTITGPTAYALQNVGSGTN